MRAFYSGTAICVLASRQESDPRARIRFLAVLEGFLRNETAQSGQKFPILRKHHLPNASNPPAIGELWDWEALSTCEETCAWDELGP
jgi:hypothetical protein